MTTHLVPKGIPLASRRGFLRGAAALGGAALATPFLSRRAFAEPTELTMLAWYGHAEPDVVAEFEAENNVRFVPKYYTGGDNMLALISQSPPGTFDVILSDAEYVQQLNAMGYIEPLDPADYAFDEFFPEFQQFPGHWVDGQLYSVITRFGFLGVAYNTDALTEAEASSYNVFWDERLKGKLGHFDWHLPNYGEMSLLAGNASPYDIDAAAWQAVQDKTMTLRPNVGGFFDYGGTFSSLESGEMLAFAGIGDWITGVLERNGAKVRSVIPEEGGLQWTESFSIGRGSAKADLAKAWIQYITSAKGQVKSATMAAYPAMVPNQKGWELLGQEAPEEGGLQWTESFSIGRGSAKADLAKAWIQYITSAKGQVKSATMAAYPAMVPNQKGWELLAQEAPEEARRQNMVLGQSNAMDLIRSGRIQYRQLPIQQSLEEWADAWSAYKGN